MQTQPSSAAALRSEAPSPTWWNPSPSDRFSGYLGVLSVPHGNLRSKASLWPGRLNCRVHYAAARGCTWDSSLSCAHLVFTDTPLFFWAKTPREKVGRHTFYSFTFLPATVIPAWQSSSGSAKGHAFPSLSWCHILLPSDSEPRSDKLNGFWVFFPIQYDLSFLGLVLDKLKKKEYRKLPKITWTSIYNHDRVTRMESNLNPLHTALAFPLAPQKRTLEDCAKQTK